MEYEDSRNALFPEPNAYIQHCESKEHSPPKKVIFQEPYENVPNFYIDNNFKKGDCDCIPKPKHPSQNHSPENRKLPFSFDLKSLLPLIGSLGNGGGMGNLLSIFSNNSNTDENKQNSNLNLSNIINLFTSNNGGNGLLDMFKSFNLGNLFKNNNTKKEMKSTDFCIKDYERID